MTFNECFLCHSMNRQLHAVSFTSSRRDNSDGIIQVCDECYGVLFE